MFPEKFLTVGNKLYLYEFYVASCFFLSSADPNFEYVEDKLTVVQHDGVVTWVPNVRLRAYCTFNMRMFPFDSQVRADILMIMGRGQCKAKTSP